MPRHKCASPPWPADDGPWTLFYKPHRKYARWAVAVTAPTYHGAAALIGSIPNADWWITNRPNQQEDDQHEHEGAAPAAAVGVRHRR